MKNLASLLVPRGGIEPPTRGFSVPVSSSGSPKLAGLRRAKTLSQLFAPVNGAGGQVDCFAFQASRAACCSFLLSFLRWLSQMKPQRGPPERLGPSRSRPRSWWRWSSSCSAPGSAQLEDHLLHLVLVVV